VDKVRDAFGFKDLVAGVRETLRFAPTSFAPLVDDFVTPRLGLSDEETKANEEGGVQLQPEIG
jgi:hypothetical protein